MIFHAFSLLLHVAISFNYYITAKASASASPVAIVTTLPNTICNSLRSKLAQSTQRPSVCESYNSYWLSV